MWAKARAAVCSVGLGGVVVLGAGCARQVAKPATDGTEQGEVVAAQVPADPEVTRLTAEIAKHQAREDELTAEIRRVMHARRGTWAPAGDAAAQEGARSGTAAPPRAGSAARAAEAARASPDPRRHLPAPEGRLRAQSRSRRPPRRASARSNTVARRRNRWQEELIGRRRGRRDRERDSARVRRYHRAEDLNRAASRTAEIESETLPVSDVQRRQRPRTSRGVGVHRSMRRRVNQVNRDLSRARRNASAA